MFINVISRKKLPFFCRCLALLFLATGLHAEEVCKFEFKHIPELLNNKIIKMPEKTVAMSEYQVVDNPSLIDSILKQTAICFVVDNSSSNMTTDGDAARFKVTQKLIDKIYEKAPHTMVSIVVFGTNLLFLPKDDNVFKTVPGQTKFTGAYIPLLTLNETYTGTNPDGPYSFTGKELLDYYLQLDSSSMTTQLKYRHNAMFGAEGFTHINAGFDAAKKAFEDASSVGNEDHYIIFYSDGSPTRPQDGTMYDFVQGINVPTTFTVYYSEDAGAENTLKEMTENIKNNNYSPSNVLSAMWKITMDEDALLKLLMDNVINKIMFNKMNFVPNNLTINSIISSKPWINKKFQFDDLFPLLGKETDFEFEIGYNVTIWTVTPDGDSVKIKDFDTLHNVNFTVTIEPGTAVSDSFSMIYWGRNLNLYKEDKEIPDNSLIVDSTSDLEIRFKPYKVDTTYGYADIEIEVKNVDKSNLDKENFKLKKEQDYFTYTFKQEIKKATKGDGILQHSKSDEIVITFRNPKLPLDTLQKVYNYYKAENIRLTKAIYFDNSANGHVDSIYLGFDGVILKDHVDKIMEAIKLPKHRDFAPPKYKLLSNGIGLTVEEQAKKILTYVKPEDTIEIKDTIQLSEIVDLLPGKVSVIDSVAPVIMTASLVDSVKFIFKSGTVIKTDGGRDELRVNFSEYVDKITEDMPFKYYSLKDEIKYDATLNRVSQDGERSVFTVEELDGVAFIEHGDSIRINWTIDDKVRDTLKNKQDNEKNIRREIDVKIVPDTVWEKSPFELVLKATILEYNEEYAVDDDIASLCGLKSGSRTRGEKYKGLMFITIEPEPVDSVTVKDDYNASFSIYDALGNSILIDEDMYEQENWKKGRKRLIYIWRGRNENDRKVGAGGYLAVVEINRFFDNKKEPPTIRKILLGVRE